MSKKDKAFELFDEGKNPSSPEVKALKLKGSTKLLSNRTQFISPTFGKGWAKEKT